GRASRPRPDVSHGRRGGGRRSGIGPLGAVSLDELLRGGCVAVRRLEERVPRGAPGAPSPGRGASRSGRGALEGLGPPAEGPRKAGPARRGAGDPGYLA